MPRDFRNHSSSSSILELKLKQRLAIRLFLRSRQTLSAVNADYYGFPTAYAKVEAALAPLESKTPSFPSTSGLSNGALNEFAMEAAYWLAEKAHTSPLVPEREAVAPQDYLLVSLLPLREDLFSGGERPPHKLPAAVYAEGFWEKEFQAFEESLWIELLIFLSQRKCTQGSWHQVIAETWSRLSKISRTQRIEQVYEDVAPAERATADRQLASYWTTIDAVTRQSDLKKTLFDSLKGGGADTSVLESGWGFFFPIAFTTSALWSFSLGKAPDIEDPAVCDSWIEDFVTQPAGPLTEREEALVHNMGRSPEKWVVAILFSSSLKEPMVLPNLELRIVKTLPSLPVPVPPEDWLAEFSGILAYHPQHAVSVARHRFNALTSALSYQAGSAIDFSIDTLIHFRAEQATKWSSQGENSTYPGHMLDQKRLDACTKWLGSLISEAANNNLATRAIEALRLHKEAMMAADLQQRFTALWLMVDCFLQNTNDPWKDLPIYQLLYAPKGSPTTKDSNYVPFQEKRLRKFEEEAEVLWDIRNHGGVHHGKYPRWETRSLRLWTERLTEIARLILHYCLNRALNKPCPRNPKEVLNGIRNDLKKSGLKVPC